MKTIKLVACIAGFALSTICFGQLISQSDDNILSFNDFYSSANKRIEHLMKDLPNWTTVRDRFEVLLEDEIPIESWMTLPFESIFVEEEIQVESWMLSPFDPAYVEEEIEIEPWMTAPFESDEVI